MALSLEKRRRIIQITTVAGILLTIVMSFVVTRAPYFKPGGGFELLLERLGVFGPIIFVGVQISQTIYPVIPGGLHNVIGDIVFGTMFGFVLNCTGMIIGSSINFYLGRRFGASLVRAFVSDEQFEKYIDKMNEGPAFRNLLKIGFIAPVFPDDIFCMIAGMSNLTFREFLKLVILYRPLSLFVFTFISSQVIQYLIRLFVM
ncbi:MAG: VTT domain-containing protein [Aerococcaceae bacterium]|nr:VTT domain-containing protein [Aerococcaceae bacterium]